MCILSKEKNVSFFFFTLSHSLCFSLFFRLHLSVEALSFVLLAHSGTHTKMAETLCASALCFYFNSHTLGRMAFASFFSFSSACPTRFATLLNKRSQTNRPYIFGEFRLKSKILNRILQTNSHCLHLTK